jgi:amino acid transporter
MGCSDYQFLWIIIGGFTHRQELLIHAYSETSIFPVGFLDSYWSCDRQNSLQLSGYYNVCHLGGEIRIPEKHSTKYFHFIAVGISILYICMNLGVVGVIPWQEAQKQTFCELFFQKILRPGMGRVATALVLLVAFASLFAVLLGYSRVPYAPRPMEIFSVFFQTASYQKLSLCVVLLISVVRCFVFSYFSLKQVISVYFAMRIPVQFIGQAIGVMLLRKKYRMERSAI